MEAIQHTIETHVARSRYHWTHVPLPGELAPVGGAPLSEVDDDDLLLASPTLLSHIQRTAASGGVQVLSPRSVPLMGHIARYGGDTRRADTIIVGGIASQDTSWVTFDGRDVSALVPDEPVRSAVSEPALQEALKVDRVTANMGAGKASDPASKALATALGIVDLQKRADVGGDAAALASLIESAWGIEPGTVMALSLYAVAPTGDLLRYAIGTDPGFAAISVPVQTARCLSVCIGLQSRTEWGPYSSYNWTAARVAAMSAFMQAVKLEAGSILEASKGPPPADPTCPLQGFGRLVFLPRPGSVFRYPCESFRVLAAPIRDGSSLTVRLPPKVLDRVRVRMAEARVTYTFSGAKKVLSSSTHMAPMAATAEALLSAETRTIARLTHKAPRGSNMTNMLRSYFFNVISRNPDVDAIRACLVAKYTAQAAEEVYPTHDSNALTLSVATYFTKVCENIRPSIAPELARRDVTLEAEYRALCEMIPKELRSEQPTTSALCVAMAHICLTDADSKWLGFKKAIMWSSVAAFSRGLALDVSMTAGESDASKIVKVCDASLSAHRNTWGTYYAAMSDVYSCLVACAPNKYIAPPFQMRMKAAEVGAMLWKFRGFAARGISFQILPVEPLDRMTTARYFCVRGTWVKVYMAPQYAYERLREAVNTVAGVPRFLYSLDKGTERVLVRTRLLESVMPPVLVAAAGKNRIFRYITQLPKLAEDLEETLTHVARDLEALCNGMLGVAAAVPVVAADNEFAPQMELPERFQVVDGWHWLSDIAADENFYEELVAAHGETEVNLLLSSPTASADELAARYHALVQRTREAAGDVTNALT